MDVTPSTSTTKRTQAKTSAKSTAKGPRKTLTLSRGKKATGTPPDTAAEITSVTPEPSTDLRPMIEVAAFYRAAERGFAPGHELDDWLEAERQITARYRV